MILVVGEVDAVVAEHLKRAFAVHLHWCRTNRVPVPPEIVGLLELLVSGGQGRTTMVRPGVVVDDGGVQLLAVGFAGAGRCLGVSERTVRRMVADGRLPAIDVGGCRRIRIADLVAFVAGLEA